MADNNLFNGLFSGGNDEKYKKVNDEASRRERAEALDARIDAFLAKERNLNWANEALEFVEKETRLNSDVFDISLRAGRLSDIKNEAEYIIEKEKQLLEEKRERERQEAEKRAREEAERKRLEAERIRQEEILAREKEEKWEKSEAEKADELILRLATADKTRYWVEDVKKAKNLVKNLPMRVRARCKNLAKLEETYEVCAVVAKAFELDDLIKELYDECMNDEKNYLQAYKLEKQIVAAARPYMKELGTLKKLVEGAKDYEQREKLRLKKLEEEKKARLAEMEREAALLAAQKRQKRLEEERIAALKKQASEIDALVNKLYAEFKKKSEKALQVEEIEKKITADNKKYMQSLKAFEVMKESAIDQKKKAAAEEEKNRALAKEFDGKITALHKSCVEYEKKNKTYSEESEKVDELKKSYPSACKQYVKEKDKLAYLEKASKEVKKERKEREEREYMARVEAAIKKQRKKEKLLAVAPYLFQLVYVLALVAACIFFEELRTYLVVGGVALLALVSFVPFAWFISNKKITKPVLYIENVLLTIATAVCAFIMLPQYATVALVFSGALLIVNLTLTNFAVRKRKMGFTYLALVACVLLGAGGVITYINAPGYMNVFVLAVIAIAYVLLWSFILLVFSAEDGSSSAANITLNCINPFVVIAAIVFTAIGGELAVVGAGLGVAGALVYLVETVFMTAMRYHLDGMHEDDDFNNFVPALLFGIAAIVAGISVGVMFEGWTMGLVIGITCFVSFAPVSVFTCISIFNGEVAYDELQGLLLGVLSGALSILSFCFMSNAYLVLMVSAALFYGLVFIVIDIVCCATESANLDGGLGGVVIVIAILWLIACPMSIVNMVGVVQGLTAEVVALL